MKVKLGAIITDASGKLGGHSIGRGTHSHYLRAKGASNGSRSVFKQVVRVSFLSLCKMWRELTEQQRISWHNAVELWRNTDIFGDMRYPSGFALFMRCNMRILEAEGTAILSPAPPVHLNLPTNFTFGSSVGSQLFLNTWGGGAVPANVAWVVRMTRPLPRRLGYIKKYLRKQFVWQSGVNTPQFYNNGYTARYGRFALNSRIGLEMFAVSLTSGSKSQSIFININAT